MAIKTQSGGIAKISVSGKKDVRDDFSKLVSGRNYTIDIIKFSLGSTNDIAVNGELTKLGGCKVHSYDQLDMIGKIRTGLETIYSPFA